MQSDQPRGWWVPLAYIAALALFLRFYDLPLKPLHHDEGVNTLFVSSLVKPPHVYQYDPGNYHGPTLFYLAWLSASLFGLNTVGIRLVTAVAGLVIVLLAVALRQQLGTRGALAAAAMLASSSGAVYFARYFIHETLLVCFTLAAVVCVIRWWTRRRIAYLFLAAASAGMMFATKETAIISAVVIACAATGSAVFAAWPSLPQVQHASGELRARGGVGTLTLAVLFAVVVAMLFYTSFLTNREGAIAAVETFAIWTRTGTTAHTQPWYTYLRWLSIEEWPLLVMATTGIVVALFRRADRFASFAALWAVGIVAAYSLIPYKTPWLTLNMIVPMALAAGVAFERLWAVQHRAAGVVAWTALLAMVGAGTARAAWLNFWHYDSERSPYVYVHTSREILKLVSTVDRVEAAHPQTPIAVMSRAYFPLPWYLRDYPAGYWGRVVNNTAPIIVGSVDQERQLDSLFAAHYAKAGPYLLRPGVLLLLYVRRDLRPSDPGS